MLLTDQSVNNTGKTLRAFEEGDAMVDLPHQPRRHHEIILAAERVFDAFGYSATTMERVAGEAGISKGSIYNYFRSKEDLFNQVFANAVSGAAADANQLLAGPISASEKLQQLVDNWFGRLEYYIRIGGLVLEFWATAAREQRKGDLAGWFEQMYSRWRGVFAAVVRQGIADGEFRHDIDPEVAASLLLAVIDGVMVQSILHTGVKLDGEFLAALKRSILASLAVRSGQERTGEDR